MQGLSKQLQSEAVADVLNQLLQGTSFGLFAASIQSWSEGKPKKATFFLVMGTTLILMSIAYKYSQAKKEAEEVETTLIVE